MRRIRRARRRHARAKSLFKRRVVTAGAAAAISLTAAASAGQLPPVAAGDKHQVPVAQDADRDLLADREESPAVRALAAAALGRVLDERTESPRSRVGAEAAPSALPPILVEALSIL